jgi:hypothetical protein
MVLSCLEGAIQQGLDELPGPVLIETPYMFNGPTRTLERKA